MRDDSCTDSQLGAFLRARRERLDPAALGFPGGRRRTPGLRREEVAQRANISATWYTWLEQGRGGAPSADVLDRIARAMLLTSTEREHLFLLALGRPPEARYRVRDEDVTPRLQRVLDALDTSPALIRNAVWDVLSWNLAARVTLTDYSRVPPEGRNILRYLFLDPRARAAQYDWAAVARFAVGTFRLDTARAGTAALVAPLVEELSELSPEFREFWKENDVPGPHGEAVKHIRHPQIGPLAIEYSSFVIEGRTDLCMVVYNPVTPEGRDGIARLMAAVRAADALRANATVDVAGDA